MAGSYPTISYGSTVITLPYPAFSSPPTQDAVQNKSARRTIGSELRIQITGNWYEYNMSFTNAPREIWASLIAMRDTAEANGDFVTFNWTDGYPTANNVDVTMDIGSAADWLSPVLVTFSLKLTEAHGR
jgi:hypothetical protein